MRSDAPSLLPIFRSQHQAKLLTMLYLHPAQEYALTELASTVAVPLSTAHQEMTRLAGAGLVESRSVGRTRLYQASTGHPAAPALRELLTISFGPEVVVAEEFTSLADVERVLLFGSWAARHAGVEGRPPADVDVLVVGSPHRAEVYAAADRAAARLSLPVNPVLRSPVQWAQRRADQSDALLAQIDRSPVRQVLPAGAASGVSADNGVVGDGSAGVPADDASRERDGQLLA